MDFSINPYTELGVALNATQEEIKDKYHQISKRLHPDKNQSKGALVQFQSVNMAYEILSDPRRREQYDNAVRNMDRAEKSDFVLRLTSSKRYVYPFNEPQVVYLYAEIFTEESGTQKAQQREREAKLNLTLVLDRSNSMSGTRLDRVKAAANQIIDQLSDNDYLSIISFNDFAEVVINSTSLDNRAMLKARVSMINASGGTEILKGLSLGATQNRIHQGHDFVNHLILITDGNTFGDQDQCITLAQQLILEGVSISAMGIGHEWNDEFLDELTSITGSNAEFIMNPNTVQRFLNDHVRSLANTFAERITISIAPYADVKLESAFKLSPRPHPLSKDESVIRLGNLQHHKLTSVIFQLELPGDMKVGFRSLARIAVAGDILDNGFRHYQTSSEISIGVNNDSNAEEPPANVMDALNKLTLYRMQERAKEALERGDTQEATRRLENLATRLFEHGHEELAQQALAEARQVANTNTLSENGRKTLKYGTQALLLDSGTTKL